MKSPRPSPACRCPPPLAQAPRAPSGPAAGLGDLVPPRACLSVTTAGGGPGFTNPAVTLGPQMVQDKIPTSRPSALTSARPCGRVSWHGFGGQGWRVCWTVSLGPTGAGRPAGQGPGPLVPGAFTGAAPPPGRSRQSARLGAVSQPASPSSRASSDIPALTSITACPPTPAAVSLIT